MIRPAFLLRETLGSPALHRFESAATSAKLNFQHADTTPLTFSNQLEIDLHHTFSSSEMELSPRALSAGHRQLFAPRMNHNLKRLPDMPKKVKLTFKGIRGTDRVWITWQGKRKGVRKNKRAGASHSPRPKVTCPHPTRPLRPPGR